MARYFLDSSALVKRYHKESGSSELATILKVTSDRFFVSHLVLVEVHSAFARLVREQVLTATDFSRLVLLLEADVASGLLTIVALSSRKLESAVELLRVQGLTQPLRTLDAIQLASAQALHVRRRLASFITADKKLLATAAASGFVTIDVS